MVKQTFESKIKEWLLGGGILLILSGAVAYGLNKQGTADRLEAHEKVDNDTIKKVELLEVGREKNAEAIGSIKIDLAEIKNDVKWVRQAIEDQNANTGCGSKVTRK